MRVLWYFNTLHKSSAITGFVPEKGQHADFCVAAKSEMLSLFGSSLMNFHTKQQLKRHFENSCRMLKIRVKDLTNLSIVTSPQDALALLIMLEGVIEAKQYLSEQDK